MGQKQRPGKARVRDGGRQIKSGKGDGSQTKVRVGEKIRGKVKKCNEGKETRERSPTYIDKKREKTSKGKQRLVKKNQ